MGAQEREGKPHAAGAGLPLRSALVRRGLALLLLPPPPTMALPGS